MTLCDRGVIGDRGLMTLCVRGVIGDGGAW